MRNAMLAMSCLTVCAVVLSAYPEQQRLDVKTGNWQVEYKVRYSGLPPQVQAMVDRMTAQQRSSMGLDSAKTYNACVTQQTLNTAWLKDKNCTWTIVKSTSTELDAHGTSCRAGNSTNSELDIKIHAVDSEHVRASMHGTSTGNGNNVVLDGDYTGTWTSATCAEKN